MKKVLFLGVILALMGACLTGTTLTSRKHYVENAALAPEIERAILAGEVCMKMTEDDVIASIGRPDHINRDTYQFGTKTQFVYDTYGSRFNINQYRDV